MTRFGLVWREIAVTRGVRDVRSVAAAIPVSALAAGWSECKVYTRRSHVPSARVPLVCMELRVAMIRRVPRAHGVVMCHGWVMYAYAARRSYVHRGSRVLGYGRIGV